MKLRNQNKLKQWLKKKISFRFHMSIIMLSTVTLGLLTNFLMMKLEITHPGIRYPLAVLFSYLWFLFFIRIYIRNILMTSSESSLPDLLDLPLNLQGGSNVPSPLSSSWSGNGGQFSGGGASGSWGMSDSSSQAATSLLKDSAGDSLSELVSDEGGVVILIVGAILFAVVFGSGAYLIWHSPEILSECLVQVILVSGMRKRMKSFSESEWASHIFKKTIFPFIAVFILSLILGFLLREICPGANNIQDYRNSCYITK